MHKSVSRARTRRMPTSGILSRVMIKQQREKDMFRRKAQRLLLGTCEERPCLAKRIYAHLHVKVTSHLPDQLGALWKTRHGCA